MCTYSYITHSFLCKHGNVSLGLGAYLEIKMDVWKIELFGESLLKVHTRFSLRVCNFMWFCL